MQIFVHGQKLSKQPDGFLRSINAVDAILGYTLQTGAPFIQNGIGKLAGPAGAAHGNDQFIGQPSEGEFGKRSRPTAYSYYRICLNHKHISAVAQAGRYDDIAESIRGIDIIRG